MKIACTVFEEGLEGNLDKRFGRAKMFLIFDTENEQVDMIDNKQNYDSPKGAGIQSGQTILNHGVEVLITGFVGPKAFQVLNKGNVKIFSNKEENTAKEAIQLYLAGKLEEVSNANTVGLG